MTAMLDLAYWIDLYYSQPYSTPIRHARGYLEPVLDASWSKLTIAAAVVLATNLLTLGFYFIFLKPASHIIRWLAWLCFVAGLPVLFGYLAWSVPDVYS